MSLQFGQQRGARKAVRQLVTNFMHIQWKSLGEVFERSFC